MHTVQDQIQYAMFLIQSHGGEDAAYAYRLLQDGLNELRKRANQDEVKRLFRGES